MPKASDYRWDPFTNVSTAVDAVEWHIIPNSSPYTILLNEVPMKSEPSTMSVRPITGITSSTSITYGANYTEVASTPSANQFRPDYITGADNDSSWDTGLIEFSSSNAGQLVEISYKATGTLASVKSHQQPSWWRERGDGSEGNYIPTANETISGVHNYKSVYIKSGITITVDHCAWIKCTDTFINEGTHDVSGGAGGTAEGGTQYPGRAGGSVYYSISNAG